MWPPLGHYLHLLKNMGNLYRRYAGRVKAPAGFSLPSPYSLWEDWFSCSLSLVQKKSLLLTFTLTAHMIPSQRPTLISCCLWLAHLTVLAALGVESRSLLQGVKLQLHFWEMVLSLNGDSTYVGWQQDFQAWHHYRTIKVRLNNRSN